MNTPVQNSSAHFVLGLATGSVFGAAVALALAPRFSAELRQRAISAAGDLSDAAAKRYRDAATSMGGAVDEVVKRGQAVRDDLADVVVRGARNVEQFAAAAKTDAKRA
jgi:gas vesicle protein